MLDSSVLAYPGLVSSTLLTDVLCFGFIYIVVNFLRGVASSVVENYRLSSLIPSPPRSWLFGHVFEFGRDEDGLFKRIKLIPEYPAMFCFYIGPTLNIVTTHHPDLAKAILTSNAHKFSLFKTITDSVIGDSLLTSEGKRWQKQRHLFNPAFHVEVLKIHVNVFNETIKSTLKWLEENADSNKACDIHPPCSCLSFDNMARCVMSQPGVKDGEDMQIIRNIKELLALIIGRFSNPLLHSEFLYKFSFHHKRFQSLISENDVIIKQVINDRKQILMRSSAFDVKNNDSFESYVSLLKTTGQKKIDFLDLLLLSKYEDGSSLSEAEILKQVRLFFVAGSETTGNAMTWLAYVFSQHQDWQDKCREEIIEVCGDKTEVGWEDIAKLRNLHLCIKETLRLYPIAAFIGRTVFSPITFTDPYADKKEITLKKGTAVNISVFTLHRHPDFWKNPEKFDPERFTPERSKGRPAFAYIPFSASYRNCIGQNFAMYEIKVAFAHILKNYRLLAAPDSPPPQMLPEVTLQPKDHVYVKVEKLN